MTTFGSSTSVTERSTVGPHARAARVLKKGFFLGTFIAIGAVIFVGALFGQGGGTGSPREIRGQR